MKTVLDSLTHSDTSVTSTLISTPGSVKIGNMLGLALKAYGTCAASLNLNLLDISCMYDLTPQAIPK